MKSMWFLHQIKWWTFFKLLCFSHQQREVNFEYSRSFVFAIVTNLESRIRGYFRFSTFYSSTQFHVVMTHHNRLINTIFMSRQNIWVDVNLTDVQFCIMFSLLLVIGDPKSFLLNNFIRSGLTEASQNDARFHFCPQENEVGEKYLTRCFFHKLW